MASYHPCEEAATQPLHTSWGAQGMRHTFLYILNLIKAGIVWSHSLLPSPQHPEACWHIWVLKNIMCWIKAATKGESFSSKDIAPAQVSNWVSRKIPLYLGQQKRTMQLKTKIITQMNVYETDSQRQKTNQWLPREMEWGGTNQMYEVKRQITIYKTDSNKDTQDRELYTCITNL